MTLAAIAHDGRMRWRVAERARLVDCAKAHLVVVRVGRIGPLIADGRLAISDRVGAIAELIVPGDELAATLVPADALVAPEPMQLVVAYEDDDLVVIDKPTGMHVHPIGAFRTGTVLNQLLHHAGARADQPWAAWRPHPAHRLDRAASGLVLVAKSAAIHDALRAGFHAVERRYRATVRGVVAREAFTIDAPLGRDPLQPYRFAVVCAGAGARAVTHVRVIERHADTTELELVLETGRTHQIRAHLASIGHPIAGDQLYLDGTASASSIALDAVGLAFAHPRDGRRVVISACRAGCAST